MNGFDEDILAALAPVISSGTVQVIHDDRGYCTKLKSGSSFEVAKTSKSTEPLARQHDQQTVVRDCGLVGWQRPTQGSAATGSTAG
jgi:hypothetical protein